VSINFSFYVHHQFELSPPQHVRRSMFFAGSSFLVTVLPILEVSEMRDFLYALARFARLYLI